MGHERTETKSLENKTHNLLEDLSIDYKGLPSASSVEPKLGTDRERESRIGSVKLDVS